MYKIVERNFPQFLHGIYTDGPHFSHTVEYISFFQCVNAGDCVNQVKMSLEKTLMACQVKGRHWLETFQPSGIKGR